MFFAQKNYVTAIKGHLGNNKKEIYIKLNHYHMGLLLGYGPFQLPLCKHWPQKIHIGRTDSQKEKPVVKDKPLLHEKGSNI